MNKTAMNLFCENDLGDRVFIVCGYPAIGKTALSFMKTPSGFVYSQHQCEDEIMFEYVGKKLNQFTKLNIIDFDSGDFKAQLDPSLKDRWVAHYVLSIHRIMVQALTDYEESEYVKDTIIFVSSHDEVRKELEYVGLPYFYIYPTMNSHDEIQKRLDSRIEANPNNDGFKRAKDFVMSRYTESITAATVTEMQQHWNDQNEFHWHMPIDLTTEVLTDKIIQLLDNMSDHGSPTDIE